MRWLSDTLLEITYRRSPITLIPGLVPPGYDGMTLPGGFILVPSDFYSLSPYDQVDLLAHELVHVQQWDDYGFPGFVDSYFSDYFDGRLDGLDHDAAYRRIGFEDDAYRRGPQIVKIIERRMCLRRK